MQRREVVFRGQVQGVGFRATARGIARRYRVTGYVRNQPDGSVELVAEGEGTEVARFLRELGESMAAYIRDVRENSTPPQGEFASFDIRY